MTLANRIRFGLLLTGLALIAFLLLRTHPAHDSRDGRTGPQHVTLIATQAHISWTNHPDGRIHEDDPGWNCLTMGNRICGPGSTIPVPVSDYQEMVHDKALINPLISANDSMRDFCAGGYTTLELNARGESEVIGICPNLSIIHRD